MGLELADYEQKTRDAIKAFWGNREKAKQKQIEAGRIDQGERSSVTAGKNLDGFFVLVADLVEANGLHSATIHLKRAVTCLPGYFRPTKLWDMLIMDGRELVAALEFKSQVGPSFGNNFNNRTEEAVGTGHCFWTAYRDNAFGEQLKPFVGWLMIVEDAPESRNPVRDSSPHFAVFPEFSGASYLKRYDLLCQKLMKENLYTAAATLATPRTAAAGGEFTELSPLTSMQAFVTAFASHVAATAARRR